MAGGGGGGVQNKKEANNFFRPLLRMLSAKRISTSEVNRLAAIDFDNKLRLFVKDHHIIGYNTDGSSTVHELPNGISNIEDIMSNIKQFDNSHTILKDATINQVSGVQVPTFNKVRTEWLNSKGELHRLDGPAEEWSNGSKAWYQNGQLHRVDGPAAEGAGGDITWWQHGQRHRVDGPALVTKYGLKQWWQNGKLHRTDGPAIENPDTGEEWYLNGERHRTDGPAVEGRMSKQWWQNGKLHRTDGPAIEYVDGDKEWYINGKKQFEKDPASAPAAQVKKYKPDTKGLEEIGVDGLAQDNEEAMQGLIKVWAEMSRSSQASAKRKLNNDWGRFNVYIAPTGYYFLDRETMHWLSWNSSTKKWDWYEE